MSEEQPRLTGWNPDGRPRLRGAFPQPAYRELGLGRLGEIGFAPALTSAREEVSQYRARGLAAARDVERNSESVRGGLDRKANTVVGPSLRPNPTPDIIWLGQDADWMLEYQQAASSAFQEWATDSFCRMDAEGHYDFGGLMWQGYRGLAGPDAETMGCIGYDRDRADKIGAKWATYVALLDTDRLCNPEQRQDGVQRLNIDGVPTDVELRDGREVDEWGAWRALHVQVGHPGEASAQMPRWERLPRWTDFGRPFAFHRFFKRRPGLQRAMTTLAAVLSTIQMLSHHSKATLQTAVSHAYMAAYLKTTMAPEVAKAHMMPDSELGLSEYDLKTQAYADMELKFGGKRIPVLGPNDEIVFEGLEGSSMDFDPFRNAFLRELASALGVSFEQLSLDFSRASYSSTRSSILEAWRQVTFDRAMFTRHVASLVYDCVIEEAFALGILTEPPGAPGFYEARQAYTRCTWTGPGMGWVDPLKEIDATKGRMGAIITSPQQESSGQGGDFYENVLQMSTAQKFAAKHGVSIDLGASPPTAAAPAGEEGDEEETGAEANPAPVAGNRSMDNLYIRPVDREAEMSKVMQRLMNHPLALHEPRAGMILSALRSKYCINTLTMNGEVFDQGAMDALALEGRQAAKDNATRARGRIFDEADGIAIIPVWGSLTKSWGLDPWSGVTGYDGIMAKAIAASEDENIRGIWLDIDSGGGDVTGLKACTDLLRALSQREGGRKPIFAMANEHAYSAAYAIAVCADKVFVPEFGGVGSVGVITMHASFKRMYEETGIDVTVIRGGEQKARANAMEQLPEQTRAHIQRQVDTIRNWFVSHVSACMPGLSEKTVRETEGLDYMGEDARAIGFVSGVCSELEAWGKLLRRNNR